MTDVICGATAAECRCKNVDCDGVHECHCGGSWSGDIDTDTFDVHRFPSSFHQLLDPYHLLVPDPDD